MAFVVDITRLYKVHRLRIRTETLDIDGNGIWRRPPVQADVSQLLTLIFWILVVLVVVAMSVEGSLDIAMSAACGMLVRDVDDSCENEMHRNFKGENGRKRERKRGITINRNKMKLLSKWIYRRYR